jgi:hypothetical protein
MALVICSPSKAIACVQVSAQPLTRAIITEFFDALSPCV